ncbi:MAG: hypothetical protein IPM07_18500 [Anaerolineales bacterium]|nr:hypothetical protein [Anaerolineales bacterium]
MPAALAAALRSIAERLAAEGVAIDSPEALEQALAARPDLQSRLEAALREVAPASDLPGSSAASWKVPDDKSTSLPDLLNRFLDAETWDESQRLVEAYPELLSDEADALFAAALDENAANPDAMQLLTTHRDLLRRCRDAGIARAFAEQMLGADGLAAAARQGLAPEAFLAQMRAAQPQMPPALREVLAALAAEGVEIHSQEDLDAALASRPALRARLAQAMAEQSGSSVPPEFAGDLRAAQAGEQRYQRIGDLTA